MKLIKFFERTAWTREEDIRLLKEYSIHFTQWKKISKKFEGRNEYAVKNRISSLKKKAEKLIKKNQNSKETPEFNPNSIVNESQNIVQIPQMTQMQPMQQMNQMTPINNNGFYPQFSQGSLMNFYVPHNQNYNYVQNVFCYLPNSNNMNNMQMNRNLNYGTFFILVFFANLMKSFGSD